MSTWRQPSPPPSAQRSALIGTVAGSVAGLSPGRLRIAVDRLTGAGKTCFGHELAGVLRGLGRPIMRASLDDFKHPWRRAQKTGMTASGAKAITVTFTTSAQPGTCCFLRVPARPVR